MQVDFDRLSKYEEAGKLRHSVHPGGALHVWCYSVQTQYTRDWDDLTRLCRGLVTDGEGNVISRSFPKFFNWGEPEAPGTDITSGPFWAYDKMDGTLIVVGEQDGEAIVSTKGSFATWHSEAARSLLAGWKPIKGTTAIFELIHPHNRIVVDYGDREDLTLLGVVENETGQDHFQPEIYADDSGWFGSVVVPRSFRLQAMLQSVKDPENGYNREGFVLVWPNAEGPSHRAKIKFAQYIELHHALSRISNVKIWEALSTDSFDAFLEEMPDEVYPQVHAIAAELNSEFEALSAIARADALHAEKNFETRKDQAAWMHKGARYPSLSFMVLDGRDIGPRVWSEVRPKFDPSSSFLK